MLGAFRAFGASGKIASSEWRRRRLLILCYHGISLQDEHEWDPGLFVTPAFLRRRFEILRSLGYTVLPLGAATDMLAKGQLPQRAVVLTFDDGFYDFQAAAVPLLEEFGYAATVYLSTYYCLNQRPLLFQTIQYALWRARSRKLPQGTLPGQHDAVDLSIDSVRAEWALKLTEQARTLATDREKQTAWLAGVVSSLGTDWQRYVQSRVFHLMTEDEVADVARRGVDVQLHTHRHRTPRDESVFRYEIEQNRKIIERLTGAPANHFCYPSGDYDSAFLPWLSNMGVKTATTCEVALARSDHDPLLLPRFIDTMGQSEIMFESWLSGVAGLTSFSRV